MEPENRVIIWNSYFCEAYNFAKKLKDDKSLEGPELDGGTLPFEKHNALMTLLHLALAIDARANHLLHEMKEERIIDINLRNAIKNVRGEYRWALLPILVGKEKISFDKEPHNAIREIYKLRNSFVHLRYEDVKFIEKIPSKRKTLRYYNCFIVAMEDMNVILGRAESGRTYVKNLII